MALQDTVAGVVCRLNQIGPGYIIAVKEGLFFHF